MRLAPQPEPVSEVLRACGMDEEVLDEYGLIPVHARAARGGVKLRTASGARLLKRVHMPVDRLRYVFLGAEHAAAQGLPGVPRFIRNRYGDPFVIHETGLYYLTAWVSGRDPDAGKVTDLAACAAELARWHMAMSAFGQTVDWQPEARPLPDRLAAALPELERDQEPSSAAGSFARLYAACRRDLAERLRFALAACAEADYESLHASSRAEGRTCHGRFVRQSLVYTGNQWCVLDYDRTHPGPPVEDLALFLHRYLPAHAWNGDVLARALAAYEAVRPLEEAERFALAALLSAPLRSVQVVLWYMHRARAWDEDEYVDALESSLELEEPRQAAVNDVLVRSPHWALVDGAEAGDAGERVPVQHLRMEVPVEVEEDAGGPSGAADGDGAADGGREASGHVLDSARSDPGPLGSQDAPRPPLPSGKKPEGGRKPKRSRRGRRRGGGAGPGGVNLGDEGHPAGLWRGSRPPEA